MGHCQCRFVWHESDETADGLWCIVLLEILFLQRGGRMTRTTVFLNNGTQAVRLPNAVALDDDVCQVTVLAVGRSRVIAPVGESWDSWFDGPGVTPDFLAEREQPVMQIRRSFDSAPLGRRRDAAAWDVLD